MMDIQKIQQQPVKFSSGLAVPLAQAFSWMSRNPLAEVVVKDVLGFNAPKMTVAAMRSKGDFLDTTRLEMSNTAVTLFGSLALPPLMRRLASAVSGISNAELMKSHLLSPQQLKQGGKAVARVTQKQMAHLAGSFGFLMPFAMAFIGVPYLRNAITLAQNKTANFEALIGLEKPTFANERRPFKQEMAYQLGMLSKILTLGVGMGVASTVGLGLLSRKLPLSSVSKGATATVNQVYKLFHLGGKAANQITGDLSVFTFWLLPAYAGWLMASRSKNEFREQLVKSVNSVLWFSVFNRFFTKPMFATMFKNLYKRSGVFLSKGPRKLVSNASLWQRLMHRSAQVEWIPSWDSINKLAKTNPNLFKQFRQAKLNEELANMGISVGMLAATPSLLNIALTKSKYEAEQKNLQALKALSAEKTV